MYKIWFLEQNISVADGNENMLDDKYVVWEGVWKEFLYLENY